MKSLQCVLMVCLLFLMTVISASAQTPQEMLDEQLKAGGASELWDVLPDETKTLMQTIGIDGLSLEAMQSLQPQTVLSTLWDCLSPRATAPFSAALLLLGTVLLLGFFSALQPSGGERSVLFQTICVLAAVVPLLAPLWQTLQRAAAAADSASVFSLGFAPVYAATLAAQGSAVSALTYQTVMIAAAEGISLLVSMVIVPLASVSLALGIAGAIDPVHRIGQVGVMVGKTNTWLLTGALTVFVAMLSFQSILAAGADTVGGRMLRFSVAGFVPIVGGSLAEALYTVQGCLSALRGTIGGFGVLCTALIVLPTLFECVVWDLLLFFVKTVSDLFGFSSVAGVASIAKSVMKTLIAVLASLAMLMIISLTLVTMGAGGVR